MEHTNVNAIEAAKQLDIINELKVRFEQEKSKTGKTKTYHIETFGCQMNSRDSEKIAGILKQMDMRKPTAKRRILLYLTPVPLEKMQTIRCGEDWDIWVI